MKKILVTGGTVFVSKYVAEYFTKKGHDVFVLNRNTREQPAGTTLINCDRLRLGNTLRNYHFDAVLDITAYTKMDIQLLINALGETGDYIFLSSSAVYPETSRQPFTEERPVGSNSYWGDYGVHKYEAENLVFSKIPRAYVLRPPYLYGPMNNLYREAFVFECAERDRPFYIPENGEMKLQFFYIEDLCRFMEIILEKHPQEHIFNLGNEKSTTVSDWVKLCYNAAGKNPQLIQVLNEPNQRNYFSFHNYEYALDITKQMLLMPETKPMAEGLKESYEWYQTHKNQVNRKPYLEYIEKYFTKSGHGVTGNR